MNKIWKILIIIFMLGFIFNNTNNVGVLAEDTNITDDVDNNDNGDSSETSGSNSSEKTEEENIDSTEKAEEENQDSYGRMEEINQVEANKTSAHNFTESETTKSRASNPYGTYWSGDYFYQANGARFGSGKCKRVIDVSQWQGTINWNAVKASKKIDAAIIRIGYAWDGYDTQAARNISECNRLGIPYSIYLFSYANTASQGTSEAVFTYNLIKRYGVKPCMPIYYDLETWSYANGTQRNPSSTSAYVSIINNYRNYLNNRGYTTHVYSYRSMLNGVLNSPSIWKYTSWMAAYTQTYGWSNPYYNGITGWQYSSSEGVNGISGNVDMSAFYNFYGVDTQNHKGLSTGKSSSEPTISYRACNKYVGWLDYFTEPNTAGTTGRNLPLYQLQIKEVNESKAFDLDAKIYINGQGWKNYNDVEAEDTIGISNNAMRVVNFTLNDQPGYKLQYRVHSASLGWQAWVDEGSNAGDTKYDIQAIEFRLVKDTTSTNYNTKALYYQSHVADVGWQAWRADSGVSGTTGQSKRVEAIKIGFLNNSSCTINARAYVQDQGWKTYNNVNGDTIIGTTGASKALQAISFTTAYGDGTALQYRVHVSNVGWTNWVNEGSSVGTIGKNQIEAIQIRNIQEVNTQSISFSDSNLDIEKGYTKQLNINFNPTNTTDDKTITYKSSNTDIATVSSSGLLKGINEGTTTIIATSSNGKTTSCTINTVKPLPKVTYSVHQQDYGWENNVVGDQAAGVTGKSKHLEAIKVSLKDTTDNYSITSKVHIQDIGWKNYGVVNTRAGATATAGTTGKGKRIEAISYDLKGLDGYKLQYSVHIAKYGWTNWFDEGTIAGTVGSAQAIESVKFRLVKENVEGTPQVIYRSYMQNKGWQSWISDEKSSGMAGKSLRCEAINISVDGLDDKTYLSGKIHIQNVGWKSYSKINSGTLLGSTGKSQRIEAIDLQLNNSEKYKLQYSVYIQGSGWTDWFNEGSIAGTIGKSKRIEDIKIRIVKK